MEFVATQRLTLHVRRERIGSSVVPGTASGDASGDASGAVSGGVGVAADNSVGGAASAGAAFAGATRDDRNPTLAFINSLGTDLRIWDGVVGSLAGLGRTLSCIRHDKRGHGLSDCPPGPYAIEDFAEDLLSILDAYDVSQAVLVGVSVGGLVAMQLALSNPERVRALVLSDTAARIGTVERWQGRVNFVRERGMAQAAQELAPGSFAPAYPSQRTAEFRGYRNMLGRMPQDGYVATCQALRDGDLRSVLHRIRVPALVLGGSEDASTPPAQVIELAESLPDARFELIEDAGHLPCLERPERVAELMKDFLDELDGR